MGNRETKVIIDRLLAALSDAAHQGLDRELKLGRNPKDVEDNRGQLNQLFGQLKDKFRDIED